MSDQDFFFDEDTKADKPAAKASAKGGTAAKPAAKSAAKPVDSGAVSMADQAVSMTVAVLIGVIGVLLGAIIGLFVGKSMAVPTLAAETGAITAPGGTGSTAATGTAPQLSPEQLQNGKLPAGHPSIGGTGTASSTPGK